MQKPILLALCILIFGTAVPVQAMTRTDEATPPATQPVPNPAPTVPRAEPDPAAAGAQATPLVGSQDHGKVLGQGATPGR